MTNDAASRVLAQTEKDFDLQGGPVPPSQAGTYVAPPMPGQPRWNETTWRFEEDFGVAADVLAEDLGMEVKELGYPFFEPEDEATLYLVRGLKPGRRKTIGTGKDAREISVHAIALLQHPDGRLLHWDISAKSAYGPLVRALYGSRQRLPGDLRDALQQTYDASFPVWVHRAGEQGPWYIRAGTAQDREHALALLATAEA